MDDCVPGGGGHSLLGGSGNEVELIGVSVRDGGVYHSSWHRVLESPDLSTEDPGVHSLADVDVHELGLWDSKGSEGELDLIHLWLADALDLAFTHSVPVEDDPLREDTIRLLERLTGFGHSSVQRVRCFLSKFTLNDTGGPVLGG